MTVLASFNPTYGSGNVVSAGAASASSAISKATKSVCLTNLGANTCYVRIGTGVVAASSADYPVPPQAQVVITKFQDFDVIAYIAATGTTDLHIMSGEGF